MISGGQLGQLNAMFNSCMPLTLSDPLMQQNFFGGLYGMFQGQVQYNGQGVSNSHVLAFFIFTTDLRPRPINSPALLIAN